jgi:hypothetical protein
VRVPPSPFRPFALSPFRRFASGFCALSGIDNISPLWQTPALSMLRRLASAYLWIAPLMIVPLWYAYHLAGLGAGIAFGTVHLLLIALGMWARGVFDWAELPTAYGLTRLLLISGGGICLDRRRRRTSEAPRGHASALQQLRSHPRHLHPLVRVCRAQGRAANGKKGRARRSRSSHLQFLLRSLDFGVFCDLGQAPSTRRRPSGGATTGLASFYLSRVVRDGSSQIRLRLRWKRGVRGSGNSDRPYPPIARMDHDRL